MSLIDSVRDGLANFMGSDISQDKINQFNTIPASLFFVPNKKYGIATQNSDTSILSVQFGIILQESHSLENNITSHPIEGGSPITDHIQNELRKGSLKCLISNHSIIRGFAPQPPPDNIAAGTAISTMTRPGWKQENVALNSWEMMKTLWRSCQLVTVVTSMETYTNVGIKSIATQRDGETGDWLEFDLSFQEVSTVTLGTKVITTKVNANTSKGKKVAGKASQGKKQTKEVEAKPGKTVKPSAMEKVYHSVTGR